MDLRTEYEALVDQGLALDLTRGKPAPEQLDLSVGLIDALDCHDIRTEDGLDVRNYGGLEGLTEMRRIFADLLNVELSQVLAGGNSSLELMHETLANAVMFGFDGCESFRRQAANAQRPVQMICPVPGYDRHFALTAHLGIDMVPVAWGDSGPDLAEVAELAADPLTKGMWLVPMYANPGGQILSAEVLDGLLRMPAAKDFRILWDNAYAIHHLGDEEPRPLPVLQLAAQAGHPDRVIEFASTSKVTYAGAGVAAWASSAANLAWFLGHAKYRRISPDKVNQLRHVRFFGDADGVRAHMRKHRELLAPKFAVVQDVLSARLGEDSDFSWSHPTGGYFINLTVAQGTATRVVALAKAAGVALTPAGSAFPYGRDPQDSQIRLAPSMPSVSQLRQAMEVVAVCALLARQERGNQNTQFDAEDKTCV